jgi:hypothetical protein
VAKKLRALEECQSASVGRRTDLRAPPGVGGWMGALQNYLLLLLLVSLQILRSKRLREKEILANQAISQTKCERPNTLASPLQALPTLLLQTFVKQTDIDLTWLSDNLPFKLVDEYFICNPTHFAYYQLRLSCIVWIIIFCLVNWVMTTGYDSP